MKPEAHFCARLPTPKSQFLEEVRVASNSYRHQSTARQFRLPFVVFNAPNFDSRIIRSKAAGVLRAWKSEIVTARGDNSEATR